ncbi:MAG: hypothetical protein R3F61_29765 [Myxococcota bacterium]
MNPAALNRVLGQLGADRPLLGLADLSDSALRTLELALARERAERSVSDLRAQAGRTPVVAASPVDPRVLHRIEGLAWASLPAGTTPLALSPVQPLGLSHTLAGTPQDNVLSATRAVEVCGDPTAALTLELAARRVHEPTVRLATHLRTVRMQPLTEPGHTAHFQLLALVSGARTAGSERVELELLLEHLRFYLDWLVACRADGFAIGGLAVRLTDFEAVRHLCAAQGEMLDDDWRSATRRLEARGVALPMQAWPFDGDVGAGLPERLRHRLVSIGSDVCAPLGDAHPDVPIRLDLTRLRQATYYTTLGFHIDVELPVGTLALCDGGFVDWSQRVLQNRKERELTSGAGTELLARLGSRGRTRSANGRDGP